jgi:PAS domain S-box-containing protein
MPASPDDAADAQRLAEARAAALFQASPLPLWVYDLETMRFLDVNEVACAKYGWSRDEFLRMTLLDIRPPEDAAAVRSSVRETPPGVFNSGIWRHRLRDGRVIHVEITSHEMTFQGRLARFVCPIDVTERLRYEEALRESEAQLIQANEALEERVRDRTAQLEVSMRELAAASAEAERANRAKSEFLSSMSHELRTPLNAIIGFGQLLAMPEVMNRPAAERASFVEHIVDAGRHLLALINEILNLAQIEAGHVSVELDRVRVAPLLAECEVMVRPLAAARGIVLRFDDRCTLDVLADRMRLKQVLLNLLSNAVKYNREQGTIDVECGAIVRNESPRVVFAVRDAGQGLDTEQLAGLFQPFNRLGRQGDAAEGTGIGLVVTRRLVELMGGSIAVHSTRGVGTEFRVELPGEARWSAADGEDAGRFEATRDLDSDGRAGADRIAGSASDGPLPDRAIESASASESSVDVRATVESSGAGVESAQDDADRTRPLDTILCVDDDPVSLRLVQEVLSAVPGVQVLTASNGRLGVDMARALVPAVIVMDNHMPELTGRAAQALLRNDPRTAQVPVIALSANAMPEDVQASLDAGFYRYVTKPFDVARLREAVQEALAAARARRLG